MTQETDESDEDIASDVLPAEVIDPAIPMELTETAPWHRPRKQFIRERQWLALSAQLIERLDGTPALSHQLGGDKELRYLTLPGIDYFDVSLLAKQCKESGVVLTSTGYLAGQQNLAIASRASWRESSLIDQKLISINSHTFERKIEDISHHNSSALKDLKRKGPFHIVNLDACGSLAPIAKDDSQRLVDAIYRIIEFQLDACSWRWLLFVTTDVRPDNFSSTTLDKFKEAIISNASASDEFEVKAIELLGSLGDSVEAAIEAAEVGGNKSYLHLFALGFSKWLLHIVEGKQWSMKIHNSYYYSTTPADSDQPSMPCLAFEFIPPPRGLPDRYGVTNVAPTPGNEPSDMSIRTVEKVAAMMDLDEYLNDETELTEALLESTRGLLREARYAASAIDALE